MKKAIVTYVDGEDFEEMLSISEPLFKHYAHKCGADYIVVRGGERKDLPIVFSKCEAAKVFAEYDRSLFLDVDIIIQGNPPNFFEQYNMNGVCGFDELPHLQFFPWFWSFNRLEEHRESQKIELTSNHNKYVLNTGMFQVSKDYAHLFDYPEYPIEDGFNEQGLWTIKVQQENCFHPVPLRWNCLRNLPCFYHEYKDSHFIHFNIKPNEKRLLEMRMLANGEDLVI